MEFHITSTKDDIIELTFLTYGKVNISRKKDISMRIIFSVFFICTWFLLFFNPRDNALWYIGIIFSAVGLIIVFPPLIGRFTIERRRIKLMNKGCQEAIISIDEKGVRTKSDDGNQDVFFGWAKITSLIISDNLYVFFSNSGIVIFFNKRYVPNQEKMLEYVTQCLEAKKVTYRKS